MYSVNQTKTNRYCGLLVSEQRMYKVCKFTCMFEILHVKICRRDVVVQMQVFLRVLKSDLCSVLCLTQHHSEGVEGSASSAQL